MILKKIILKNFQSHEDSEINFNNGFNCIIGPNNSGKSSLIRALSFIFEGRFNKSWIRTGTNQTLVEVILDNLSIKREKGDRLNKVKIVDDNNVEEFENFGTRIPSSNINYKQLGPLRIRNNEITFYDKQFSDFFVFETPSIRAEIIRAIFGFDKVDEIVKNIRSRKDELNREIRSIEKTLEENKNKIEIKIRKKDELSLYLDKIKEINDRIKSKLEKIDKLKKLKIKVEEQDKITNKLQTIYLILEKAEKIENKMVKSAKLTTLKMKTKLLFGMNDKIFKSKEIIDLLVKLRDKVQHKEKLQLLFEKKSKLENCKDKIKDLFILYDKKLEVFKEILNKTKTCPLCLSKIEDLDRIIEYRKLK